MADPNTYIHGKNAFICGMQPRKNARLPIRTSLCMGFGLCFIRRSPGLSRPFQVEHRFIGEEAGRRTMRWVERLARDDPMPHTTWRVEFHSPMTITVYERRGKSRWYLVEAGPGFA